MCGIAGVVAFTDQGKKSIQKMQAAISSLSHRGPDHQNIFFNEHVALGHSRLSIIDTSENAHQPMFDASGQYVIVFNGEIFNFPELRQQLINEGTSFKSKSDTEVILHLYINEGPNFIHKLNGFFAFAIYNKYDNTLFVARDRFGVKPLLIYSDNDRFLFASEMKALMQLGVPKELDHTSIYNYLQLNYIDTPYSIFKNIKKLNPGSCILITDNKITESVYYAIPHSQHEKPIILPTYETAKKNIYDLLNQSVEKQLISDVPIGVFLSGGIDSSIITALASQHNNKLHSFSIGFKNSPFFDESHYAEKVAKKFNTEHHTFNITEADLLENVFPMLDALDEPFADSSALLEYILSKKASKHVKVALSGDGADELFGGYNKHQAEASIRSNKFMNLLIKTHGPLLKMLPQSRNSYLENKIRQANRYYEGLKLNEQDRYWQWCTTASAKQADSLLKTPINKSDYLERKHNITKHIIAGGSLNDILYADMHLVLQGDMLQKVDLMTMANSLEVRTPFLDHLLVDYCFGLPAYWKVTPTERKKILIDTFKHLLPAEIINRPKHGFEIPLLPWLRGELNHFVFNELLSDDFVSNQNIFNLEAIKRLKKQLFSTNPGDVHAQIWALLVFQYWWKKYMMSS